MASTNQTAHYNLSQYVANDKPTYLVDYNGDMSKIDAGIYGADARSLVNETAIGDLTNLDTTAKNNLVSAINEVNTQVTTNTNNISTNTSNISTLGGNVGDIANLTTTAKNNVVSAINEVKAENVEQQALLNKFNLLNNTQIDNNTMTCNIGTIAGNSQLFLSTNSDNSIFKLYGEIRLIVTGTGDLTVSFNTPLRPTEDYFITGIGYGFQYQGNYQAMITAKVETTGRITLYWYSLTANVQDRFYLPPCIYFNNNFGDIPQPSNN